MARPKTKRAPKMIGRPRLPPEHAKSRIVPVRFKIADLEKIEAAAKTKDQTVSEWIRRALAAKIEA
jgi:hypothetical protein